MGRKLSSHTGRYSGVPILKGEELLGVLLIYHLEVRPFTDRQIALVETFADQAAIAIENARLFETERQRSRELTNSLEQQTATSEVLKVMSRSVFDLQPVFDAIAENGVRLCEAERAFIFRFDGEFLRAVGYYNVGLAIREFVDRNPVVPGSHSISARAALERRTPRDRASAPAAVACAVCTGRPRPRRRASRRPRNAAARRRRRPALPSRESPRGPP